MWKAQKKYVEARGKGIFKSVEKEYAYFLNKKNFLFFTLVNST